MKWDRSKFDVKFNAVIDAAIHDKTGTHHNDEAVKKMRKTFQRLRWMRLISRQTEQRLAGLDGPLVIKVYNMIGPVVESYVKKLWYFVIVSVVLALLIVGLTIFAVFKVVRAESPTSLHSLSPLTLVHTS